LALGPFESGLVPLKLSALVPVLTCFRFLSLGRPTLIAQTFVQRGLAQSLHKVRGYRRWFELASHQACSQTTERKEEKLHNGGELTWDLPIPMTQLLGNDLLETVKVQIEGRLFDRGWEMVTLKDMLAFKNCVNTECRHNSGPTSLIQS
jgi:hypothetical protein